MNLRLRKQIFKYCFTVLLAILSSVWMLGPLAAHALPATSIEFGSVNQTNLPALEQEEAIKVRFELKATNSHNTQRQSETIGKQMILVPRFVLHGFVAFNNYQPHIRPEYYDFLFRYKLF